MQPLRHSIRLTLIVCLIASSHVGAQDLRPDWNQWRGPTRDGRLEGGEWPGTLSDSALQRVWRVELPPSYSGPIVSKSAVFVTGTANRKSEVVVALDRDSGDQLWRADWNGAMQVPFFAAANGSWIRSTPALDGNRLYVAGMRDVLVCLDAGTGAEQWKVDFSKRFGTPLPGFGCVCSPLVDGDAVYLQAGAGFVKLNKATGEVIWRSLQDGGSMSGGAFSSPVMATLSDRRQLLVQTRQKLAGVDPDSGSVLWEQVVPSFRGMNILSPVPVGDAVFTSTYRNGSWLFDVSAPNDEWRISENWSNRVRGYMSTPVVVDGHAYLHLQNQRFTCIDLNTGESTWTSKPYGKYASLVAQEDRILALDQRGSLLLFEANPREFELLDQRTVSDDETWAHLAVSGDQLFVRELEALSVYRWSE